MEYKGIIFDLDGTLVTTKYEHRKIVLEKTLSDFGKPLPIEVIDKFWFEGNRDKIIKEIFEVNPSNFWTVYESYDTPEFRKKFTNPYDDVGFVLELKKRGYKTGVVTSAPVEIAKIETEMVGKEFFDSIVVAHTLNGFIPKPNPSGLEQCLFNLGIKNTESIFVGNSDEDVNAARNANILDILINRKEYFYKNLNPSLSIESLYDLDKFLS